MSRKVIVITSVMIILFAAVYGTLAYFTAEGKAASVISAGNIKMVLHQETADGRPSPDNVGGLMPGQSADRIVYVENSGDNAFYTRIKLTPSVRAEDGSALSPAQISLNIDTANWKLGADGWYYYQSALSKGAISKPLFNEVSFAPDMGNDYMNANVSIGVNAQAVQCANNGDTVLQAVGWPAESAKG